MNRRALIPTALTAMLSAAAMAHEIPTGDPAAGKKLADEICSACHGMDGNAIVPAYPDLAGQNAPYLVMALKAYKSDMRTGLNAGIMAPMAKRLSEQEMADVAAYYESLE